MGPEISFRDNGWLAKPTEEDARPIPNQSKSGSSRMREKEGRKKSQTFDVIKIQQ